MTQIEKRNGRGFEPFDVTKVQAAVLKAANRVDKSQDWSALLRKVSASVEETISSMTAITVDDVHTEVENTLMRMDQFDISREYITYRKAHMPDIFRPRAVYRPFEYPDLHKYVDAVRQSYWTHDEFDYTADVQDFKINMCGKEREAVRRCMLAISHIEVSVKTFWAKLGDRLPKAELAEIGITMGESEVRHANAYAELLNRLGLNDDFSEVANVPAIKARQKYMDNAMSGNTGSNKDYMESVLLFSLFIENVSLFSQFLVLMVMNQDKGYLKGISNAISSTALEENLHAKLGADIIKTIRIEQPSWFTPELDARVNSLVAQSFEAEKDILNWIFELGDISSISKLEVTEYVKNRYNLGLQDAGFSTYFSVDTTLLEKTEFFDLQVNTTTHVDFFNKRSSNYTKKASSFDADSLF